MPKKTNLLVLLLALLAALATAGCHRDAIYSHYEHTDIEGWERDDTLSFLVTNIPRSGNYNETVGIRLISTFPYKSLTLILRQYCLASSFERTDTLTAQLTDDKSNTLGKSCIDHSDHLFSLPPVHLQQGDTLCIELRHNMRRTPLPGISDVGITLSGSPSAESSAP